MFEADINLWVVLAAAVAYFIIGAIWYMALFGKQWMELSGMSMEDTENSSAPYLASFVLTLVLTFILAHVLVFIGVETIQESLVAGLWLWLGFVATTMLMTDMYSDKPRKLTAINAGYHLAGILAAASIITFWG